MDANNTYFDKLKALVEQSAMRPMKTSADFDYLYETIQNRINETIGVTTLKRLWNYINGYKTVRESTLDVLCRFVGFPDWHSFVADYCGVESEQTSHRIVTATVSVKDLKTSETVTIEWNPGRRLVLLHQGEGVFDVLESKNSKVVVGDSFHCESFVFGQPLFMDNYIHNGQEPTLFVVGKKGGLTKMEIN